LKLFVATHRVDI